MYKRQVKGVLDSVIGCRAPEGEEEVSKHKIIAVDFEKEFGFMLLITFLKLLQYKFWRLSRCCTNYTSFLTALSTHVLKKVCKSNVNMLFVWFVCLFKSKHYIIPHCIFSYLKLKTMIVTFPFV